MQESQQLIQSSQPQGDSKYVLQCTSSNIPDSVEGTGDYRNKGLILILVLREMRVAGTVLCASKRRKTTRDETSLIVVVGRCSDGKKIATLEVVRRTVPGRLVFGFGTFGAVPVDDAGHWTLDAVA